MGNVTGTNVNFLNIQENTVTGPISPLFGSLTAGGNSLMFTPAAFAALSSSVNSHDADLTDAHLNFEITADAGQSISDVLLTEAGDFSLVGNTTGNVTMSTPVNLIINDNPSLQMLTSMSFTYQPVTNGAWDPTAGSLSLPDDATGGSLWQGTLDANIAAFLASEDYTNPVTDVQVALDDILSASSTVGSAAKIEKKTFDVAVTSNEVSSVPEPGTLALLACGGLLLAAYGWRRSRG